MIIDIQYRKAWIGVIQVISPEASPKHLKICVVVHGAFHTFSVWSKGYRYPQKFYETAPYKFEASLPISKYTLKP